MGAGSAVIRGDVGRSVHGGGGNILIDGMVGKDVRLDLSQNTNTKNSPRASTLKIGDNARIGGNVTYRSQNQADIANGAVIRGKVTKNDVVVKKNKNNQNRFFSYVGSVVLSLLAAFVVAFVLIAISGDMIENVVYTMLDSIGASIGWGVAIMFLTPIIIILLMITIIGIPLALILFVAWLIALYVAKIVIGILVGRQIVKGNDRSEERSLYLYALVGLTISWIVFSLPVIGWLLWLVAAWWGLGGIWKTFKRT